MIFGRNNKSRPSVSQATMIRDIMGRRQFAIFPKKMSDGTYVWVQYYYSYTQGVLKTDGDFSLSLDKDDCLVYDPVIFNHTSASVRHVALYIQDRNPYAQSTRWNFYTPGPCLSSKQDIILDFLYRMAHAQHFPGIPQHDCDIEDIYTLLIN